MSQLDRLRGNLPVPRDKAESCLPLARERSAEKSSESTSLETVLAVLDAMEAAYVVDDDEVGGVWENGIFVFRMLEDAEGRSEVLLVHGTWQRVLRYSQYSAVLAFANDWNSEHVWPKVYAMAEEDTVGVCCEVVADFGGAPTIEQVDRTVVTGIVSALSVFDTAEASFPGAELIGDVDDIADGDD